MGYLLLLALSNGLDSHTSSFLCFKALNPSNVMYHQCFSYSGAISGYIFCLVNSIIQFENGGVTFELWFVLFWVFFSFFFLPLAPGPLFFWLSSISTFLRFFNRREQSTQVLVWLNCRSFTIAQADFQRSEFLNCYFSLWNPPTVVSVEFPEVIFGRSDWLLYLFYFVYFP